MLDKKKFRSRFTTEIGAACQKVLQKFAISSTIFLQLREPEMGNMFCNFLVQKWPHCACSSLAKVWDDDPAVPPLRKSPQKINTVSCHPYCQEVLRFFSLTCSSSSSSFESLYKSVHIHMHIQEI